MDSFGKYRDLNVRQTTTNDVKRRYSVTADVLSYRRCPRLYASQSERGFVPAQPSQRYVGSVIHQVLDRAHLHYSGRIRRETAHQIPDDHQIEVYFNEVDGAMRSHGIRPFSPELGEYILKLLQRFNRIEGNELYPRVKDTEHKLQSDRGKYLLHGVVDVLVSSTGSGKNSVEIWDYKGSRRPKESTSFGKKILEDYKFQMLVYSSLFNLRNGYYPTKGVIYFVGELRDQTITSRPTSAVLEVQLDDAEMNRALQSFDITVGQIEASRGTDSWLPPTDGAETAGRETCDACDLRFSCPVERIKYNPRIPGRT
ncbi:MAG: PD-(D/E)XK nuclease family protein [Thermoplasmatales archaeon]